MSRLGRRLLAAAGVALLSAGTARAEIVGFLEQTFTDAKTRQESPGDEPREEQGRFLQTRIGVNWVQRLFPNLQLVVGGLYETGSFRPVGEESSLIPSDRERIRPEVSLTLTTPFYRARAYWSRNEETVKTPGAPEAVRTLDNAALSLGWDPQELPHWRLDYYLTDAYDKDRLFQDSSSERLSLQGDWRPRPEWGFYYSGSKEHQEDHLDEVELDATGHMLRANYNDQFAGDRLAVNTDYRGNYREARVVTEGGGQAFLPTEERGLGLAGTSLDPRVGALGPGPWLADAAFDRPAGGPLDLITADPAELDDNLSFGLRYPDPADVDLLYVWVDQEIPGAIAVTWSWQLYVNTDQQCTTWTPRGAPGPATYLPVPPPGFASETRGRFELVHDGPPVRCIKAVVHPISASSLPPGTAFSSVLVTEMEGLVAIDAPDGVRETDSFSQSLDGGLRARLLRERDLYYEMSYDLRWPDSGPDRWTLRNGFSGSQRLGEVYLLSGRFTREDGEQGAGKRVSHDLTAGLTATPLPTLMHSVVVNARTEDLQNVTTTSGSVFLYSTAQLYRGVTGTLGAGKSFSDFDPGISLDSTQASAGLGLVPHRALAVNLGYEYRESVTGGDLVQDSLRGKDVAVTWRPYSSLYLFGYFRDESRIGLPDRSTRQAEIGWTPFPYGALELAFSYRERREVNPEQTDKTFLPSARWTIRPGWFLDVSYQSQNIDGELGSTDSDILSAILRIAF